VFLDLPAELLAGFNLPAHQLGLLG